MSARIFFPAFNHSNKNGRNFTSFQRELFLSEVNNRETIAAIEANNDTFCLQKRTEEFPLISLEMNSFYMYVE